MSDLFFKCPECGQDIESGDDLAGRMVNCPACDHLMRIPGVPRDHEEFIFECPQCGQSIDIAVDAAGLHLPCPGCGRIIDVPEPPPPPPKPAAPPAAALSGRAAVSEEEKKGSTARVDLPEGDSSPPPRIRTVLIKRSDGVQEGEISRVPSAAVPGARSGDAASHKGWFGRRNR